MILIGTSVAEDLKTGDYANVTPGVTDRTQCTGRRSSTLLDFLSVSLGAFLPWLKCSLGNKVIDLFRKIVG